MAVKTITLEEVRALKDAGLLKPMRQPKNTTISARTFRRLFGPKLDNPTLPRGGEEIGGGWIVLRRGRTTKRLKTVRWVFEHPSFEKAQEEAQRLREAFPDQTFEILSRVTEV